MFRKYISGYNSSIPYSVEKTFVISGSKGSGLSFENFIESFFNKDFVFFSNKIGIKEGDISDKLNNLPANSTLVLMPGSYEISNLTNYVSILPLDVFWDYRGANYQVFNFLNGWLSGGRPLFGTYIKLGEISGVLLGLGGIYDLTNASISGGAMRFYRSTCLLMGQNDSLADGLVELYFSELHLEGPSDFDLSSFCLMHSKLYGNMRGLNLSLLEESEAGHRFWGGLQHLTVDGLVSSNLFLPHLTTLTINYYVYLEGNLILLGTGDWVATLNFTDTFPIFISRVISYNNLVVNLDGFSEGYINEIILPLGGEVIINAGDNVYIKIGSIKNASNVEVNGNGEVIIG